MLKRLITSGFFALVFLCVGCSEQARVDRSNQSYLIAAEGQRPQCFFEQYPENWVEAMYRREVMARYEQKHLSKR